MKTYIVKETRLERTTRLYEVEADSPDQAIERIESWDVDAYDIKHEGIENDGVDYSAEEI